MLNNHLCILLVFAGFCLTVTASPPSQDQAGIWTSLPPLAWLTRQVAGDTIKVHSLLKPGQNPHIFSPRPKELAPVKKARLFFHCGTDFELMLARKISAMSPKMVMENIYDQTSNPHHSNPQVHTGHTDDACAGGRVGHTCGTHAGEQDPHVWMSPANLVTMATNIRALLAAQFPGKTAIFNENLERLVKQLNAADKAFASRLAPIKGTTFYVHHPAFGHFAERYGLIQKAVEVEGKSPTPKQLLDLVESARSEAVKMIVASPQFSDRSSRILAQKIGGTVVKVDPLNPNPLATMRQLADALLGAPLPEAR